MTPEHWLNIATRGLQKGAAQRIQAEYLAHLEDALEAGESLESVLAEWGDPHGANKELKLAHPNMLMLWLLPASYAPSGTGLFNAFTDETVPFLALAYFLYHRLAPLQASLVLLATILMTVVRWFVLSRPGKRWVKVMGWWLLNPLSVAVWFLV
ncbi:hypothetical protein ACTQ9L_00805 [Deinococcus wulumuqiensis]|uniref:Uncharacterized protein n=1 Tax=Deinococcus sp. VB142 TaxID=3112952 RepID=A0AAU6PZV9_9DEIO